MLTTSLYCAFQGTECLGVAAFSTTDWAAVAPGVNNGLFVPARCRYRSRRSSRRLGLFKPRGKCITTARRAALATYKD